MELQELLIREDFRIDVFFERVCGEFSLSDKMVERAKVIFQGKYLVLSLCSNEEIFLFKTMTERPGDLKDCIELAKRGLDWDTILKELKWQIRTSGNDIWITYVGERLDILEDKGLNIPIMQEVNKLCEEWYEKHQIA